jgi:hypothetical protein
MNAHPHQRYSGVNTAFRSPQYWVSSSRSLAIMFKKITCYYCHINLAYKIGDIGHLFLMCANNFIISYLFLNFFLLFFVLSGVHCGIHKRSYNISNIPCLNSPTPLSLPPPHFWNSFKRSHFSIYMHVRTAFSLYLPPIQFPHFLPPLTGIPPQALPLSDFVQRKINDIFVCFR